MREVDGGNKRLGRIDVKQKTSMKTNKIAQVCELANQQNECMSPKV